MKYLLTGASGFIGQALTKKLEETGHDVYALNRNLFADFGKLIDYISTVNPDYVIHLATAGNRYGIDDEDTVMSVNILYTWLLLKACLRASIKGFVNISSSSVYGKYPVQMSEEDLPKGTEVYAVTKESAELLCRYFANEYDLPVTTLRLFSVYGPGEGDHKLIPTMCRSLVTGEKLYLDPTASHDWIYIDDVVDAILNFSDISLRGGVVNIGTGNEYSNLEVATELEKASGIQVVAEERTGLRVYDNLHWRADTAKASKLGFVAKTSLKDGIAKCWEYYSKLYGK